MKYRKQLTPYDKILLEKLIALEPSHYDNPVDFWTTTIPGKVECFAVEDDKGPVFYCRVENVARIHIQFDTREKYRTAKALKRFIGDFHRMVKDRYTQVIWDSVSESLIKFAGKFGYHKSPNEIVKIL